MFQGSWQNWRRPGPHGCNQGLEGSPGAVPCAAPPPLAFLHLPFPLPEVGVSHFSVLKKLPFKKFKQGHPGGLVG